MNNISESGNRSLNNISDQIIRVLFHTKCETINYDSMTSELRCNIFKTFLIDDIVIFSHTFFEQMIRAWIVLWIKTLLIN